VRRIKVKTSRKGGSKEGNILPSPTEGPVLETGQRLHFDRSKRNASPSAEILLWEQRYPHICGGKNPHPPLRTSTLQRQKSKTSLKTKMGRGCPQNNQNPSSPTHTPPQTNLPPLKPMLGVGVLPPCPPPHVVFCYRNKIDPKPNSP